MRRADRLIKLVHFLRQRRKAVTAARIAEEFNICTRTIYRDIQDLMDSGVPIRGAAGVGYVIDKQYYLPPITFDADELEAIALGISMVRQWTDDLFATKAESAFAKIKAALPPNLQGEIEQITTYAVPTLPPVPWRVSFSSVRNCIRTRQKIMLEYCDEAKNTTTRIIWPLGLVFFNPVWLLISWCETRRDFRNFRLDRIQSLSITEAKFADEPDKNLAAYLQGLHGCTAKELKG